jgi:hypothetical protein
MFVGKARGKRITRAPFDEHAAAVIYHKLQGQFAHWHKQLMTNLHTAWAEHGIVAKADGKTPLWPWIDDAIDEPSDATMRDVADGMANAQVGAAASTIKQLDVDDPDAMLLRINTKAVDYAAARAAEIVGKRYDTDGNLIDNPNADWAITDTARNVLRREIRDGLATDRDVDRLADHITDTGIFSDDRAEMIARTEINVAMNQGVLEAGRQARSAGLPVRKVWTLGANPCPQCEDAAAEGDIDLEDDFGGDAGDAPPLHPNCECSLDLFVADDEAPEEAETEEEARKGFQMTRDEQLRATVKRHGNVIGLAKFICSQGTTDITEHELTALVVDAAKREHPDMSDAQAFAKEFGAAGPNGEMLRRAVQVAKVAQVGGDDGDADDAAAALEELHRLADAERRRDPGLSASQAFARVFADPRNAALAARAHRRPTANAKNAFPFPR